MSDKKLRLDQLTLGEQAKIEDLSGIAIGTADNATQLGYPKFIAALGFIAKRRHDPKFAWNQAMDLTQDDVAALVDLDGEEDASGESESESESEQPS